MPQYHLNEAVFELPPQLKDKTMHMFTLSDAGPSEFNVVISRADVIAQETLDEFVERLTGELRKALPKFELQGTVERKFCDTPAIELSYSWRSDGVFMHQRQVITLVRGASIDHPRALMLAGTCLNAFSDESNQAFDQILDSVQLRNPMVQQVEHSSKVDQLAETGAAVHSEGEVPLPHVFALSIRDRTLHIYGDEDEACRRVSALEVEDGLWAFYCSNGSQMEVAFLQPNSGKVWRTAGNYQLRPSAVQNAASLLSCLDHVIRIKGMDPFDSLTAVQTHLRRGKEQQPGNLLPAAET